MLVTFAMLHLGSALVPVGLLTLLGLADACDGATLDELRALSTDLRGRSTEPS